MKNLLIYGLASQLFEKVYNEKSGRNSSLDPLAVVLSPLYELCDLTLKLPITTVGLILILFKNKFKIQLKIF